MSRLSSKLIRFVLAIAVACGRAEESSAPDLVTDSEGPANVETATAIEARYTSVILAYDALVEGDLDGFRARLAAFDTQELPAGFPV